MDANQQSTRLTKKTAKPVRQTGVIVVIAGFAERILTFNEPIKNTPKPQLRGVK
jgi:hypothetical protein